ncbi:hypothetical protein [Spirosoma sp.]|uniref:hypothetical protein n=1 Tax=Spirosoma sp. TaxID=1899569 RepID=UPI0026282B30|nr:hypothetical protein [Spirosoma sp.]MCX6213818.1 hypothetical protein [Spirosoma sp.]
MAKFISVLDTHVGLSFWQAVQWDDDLTSLTNNQFYTAGVNMSLPKNPGDRQKAHKVIIERSTALQGGATIIQLSTVGQNLIALANSTATDSVLAQLTSNINNSNIGQ